jgi:hypothetical protein
LLNHPIGANPIGGFDSSESDFIVRSNYGEFELALQFLDGALRNQQGVFLY